MGKTGAPIHPLPTVDGGKYSTKQGHMELATSTPPFTPKDSWGERGPGIAGTGKGGAKSGLGTHTQGSSIEAHWRLPPHTALQRSSYRDKLFLLILLVAACAYVAVGIYSQVGLQPPYRFKCHSRLRAVNGTTVCSDHVLNDAGQPKLTVYWELRKLNIAVIFAEVLALPFGVGILSLLALRFAPRQLLTGTHVLCQLLLWGGAITSIVKLSIGWAFVWAVLAFVHLIYVALVGRPLHRTTRMYVVACRGILARHPMLALFTILWSLLQVGALFAVVNVYINAYNWGGRILPVFLLAIPLLWFSQVGNYIAHTVAAGVGATWYFGSAPVHPIRTTLLRSLTTSLGSVARGSFFVFVPKLLRVITGRFSGHATGAASVSPIADAMDSLLRRSNVYSFTMIAMKGKGYADAAEDAYSILHHRDIYSMMSDDLVSATVLVGGLLVGMACGGLSWILITIGAENGVSTAQFLTAVYIPCFLMGATQGVAALQLVESLTLTVCVCFAECPGLLEATDTVLYLELVAAWNKAQTESADVEHGGAQHSPQGSISDISDSDKEDKELEEVRTPTSARSVFNESGRDPWRDSIPTHLRETSVGESSPKHSEQKKKHNPFSKIS
eukprot:jgi/Mesvir1/15456/Mv11437-RA.1